MKEFKAYQAGHKNNPINSNEKILTDLDLFGKNIYVSSLIFPDKKITRDQWHVYLLAHKGNMREHAMLAFEGVYGYGQRILKIAHLQAVKQGTFGNYQVVINYFNMPMLKCASYLPKNYEIALFPVQRAQAKILEHAIDKEVKSGVDYKYRQMIFDSSTATLSEEEHKKITQNCLTWAVEKIESVTGINIPIATDYLPSATVRGLVYENAQQNITNNNKVDKKDESLCLMM